MQNYRVDGGTLRLGQGAIVGLTDEQAAPRLHRMDKISDGVFRLREVLEFKNGEAIRVALDDIPKHQRGIALCLDPAPEAEVTPRPKTAAKAKG